MEDYLNNRKLYIPPMSYGGARTFAAALRSVGIDAEALPFSDNESLILGSKFTSGDECLPERILIGDLMKKIKTEDFDPRKCAFFVPTAGGPCRFGQYATHIKQIFDDIGYKDIVFVSPSSEDGYGDMGRKYKGLARTGWRAIVVSDILRKILLMTRPYEKEKGMADVVYNKCIETVCGVLEMKGISHKERMKLLLKVLNQCREMFISIKDKKKKRKPIIGVVGEIFCRLNSFSNEFFIKEIEAAGGEAWLSGIGEWVHYASFQHGSRILKNKGRFSKEYLLHKLKEKIQKKDEKTLYRVFKKEFAGVEEPHDIKKLLKLGEPYLPFRGAIGEMVLTISRSIYLIKKGVKAIADISPFTCMNGVVTEAIFPRISRDLGNIPMKTFYFDGKKKDLEMHVSIFMGMLT